MVERVPAWKAPFFNNELVQEIRMPLVMRSYLSEDVKAVKSFNDRLQSGGASVRFPESPVPEWLPFRTGTPIYQEYYLAVDDDAVRGAYILKNQPFQVLGEAIPVGNIRLLMSEGIVDNAFGMVGVRLVRHALTQNKRLFALGMGGYDNPCPRLLQASKWTLIDCPFLFYVNHPNRFLRGISFLRHRRTIRLVLDGLALSGLGHLGFRILHYAKRNLGNTLKDLSSELVDDFREWVDPIWDQGQNNCSLVAVRNPQILNILYPPGDRKFLRLQVRSRDQIVGWAVIMNTPMTDHTQFGNLTVGSIVDCFAIPGAETAVISQATQLLKEQNVDLIVTNQMHRDWIRGLTRNGYLSGPSNFILAMSHELAQSLSPIEESLPRIHMNRGDGDGPINL